MSRGKSLIRLWTERSAAGVLLLALCVGVLPPLRQGVLRTVGHALVRADTEDAHALAAVLMSGIGGAEEVEAADLVQEGIVDQVVILDPPAPAIVREFVRRGVEYDHGARRSVQVLASLGVDSEEIHLLESAMRGTRGETAALARWCREQEVTSIIVVSTPHHSRRLRRTLRRAMSPGGTTIAVRLSRPAGQCGTLRV